jgi:hypothetical protein
MCSLQDIWKTEESTDKQKKKKKSNMYFISSIPVLPRHPFPPFTAEQVGVNLTSGFATVFSV